MDGRKRFSGYAAIFLEHPGEDHWHGLTPLLVLAGSEFQDLYPGKLCMAICCHKFSKLKSELRDEVDPVAQLPFTAKPANIERVHIPEHTR